MSDPDPTGAANTPSDQASRFPHFSFLLPWSIYLVKNDQVSCCICLHPTSSDMLALSGKCFKAAGIHFPSKLAAQHNFSRLFFYLPALLENDDKVDLYLRPFPRLLWSLPVSILLLSESSE